MRPNRGRRPDLSAYLPGDTLPPRRGPIHVPPSIAIEAISPKLRDTRRDRVDKLADYAALGVAFYWIVNPELRSLEILELGSYGRYVHALGTTSGVIELVPGCEGLSIDLDALCQEVEGRAPRGEPNS